jgi:long-chain fatty acid transport protein
MWGTAGMGVDYRDVGDAGANAGYGTMQMVSNLQLMQFGVPFAFKVDGFSIGAAPIIQYGSLDIHYRMPDGLGGYSDIGAGVAQDFGFGVNVGASYDFSAVGVKGLTVGAVYKSEIEMEYKQQLSSATQPFVDFGVFPAPMDDKLTQPAEIGIGVSYTYQGSTLAFDYKQIKWGDAKGYKDFGWDNQNVYAVGYEYAMNNWAVRAGFNYAEQPIDEADGTTPSGAALNMFNLLGFPATVEQHYSIGGTYEFTKVVSVDAGFNYAPETETEFDTTALTGMGFAPSQTVKHSQYGISIQGNYAF